MLGPRLSEEPYSGEDVSLLASVGTQSGLALENIRLAETHGRADGGRSPRLARARDRARRAGQAAAAGPAGRWPRSTTPAPASRRASSAATTSTSSSWRRDQFGLVLADISGKGISAALLMASLQANLRAQYARAPHDLAEVLCAGEQDLLRLDRLQSLRDAVLRRVRRDATATCATPTAATCPRSCCAAAAPWSGWASRRRSSGCSTTPWQCATGETWLAPGDTLVVFTDGVSDATSESGEEFGEDRLIALLQRHADDDALDAARRASSPPSASTAPRSSSTT